MKILYIVRGLPGSGKSTFAEELTKGHGTGHAYVDGGVALEADSYFVNEEGVYIFNPEKLAEAHTACHDGCKQAMKAGRKIAIANTFSMKWEAKPYFDLAEEHGYSVFVIECQNKFEDIHGVPEGVRYNMKERWEEIV